MQRTKCFAVIIIAVPLAAMASGHSNIAPGHKFAWGENVGWTNWRDADGTQEGVVVGTTFLGGFIWAENLGWINVGDGSPDDGVHYGNIEGSDFGVNLDADTGDLFGLAWGENIGWINFDTRDKASQRARLDRAAGRFRGYVWGENVGWINLDDEEHYVAVVRKPPLSFIDLLTELTPENVRPVPPP